ncbi:hypothetical protein M0Q50_02470 [bacterium]|jgi:hypothetical protein|nr:hypothetical protein [bacterium]
MDIRNITNDTIIDNTIYFIVKNMRTVLYVLWIIISLLLGFSIAYFIAVGREDFYEDFYEVLIVSGTIISILFAFIIALINDSPSCTYYSRIISNYIQDKYNK